MLKLFICGKMNPINTKFYNELKLELFQIAQNEINY